MTRSRSSGLRAQGPWMAAAAAVLGLASIGADPAPIVPGTEGPSPGHRRPTASPIAFVDVNVVPMDGDRVLRDWTVVVRDGRIVDMGPADRTSPPADAERIEGRGRYLAPGLADMHVHLVAATDFWLYLANGVTTVRNMAGRGAVVAWRDSIAEGRRPGPTIITAGPIVDGEPPTWPGSAAVELAADADSIVAGQVTAGYDFIKVYGGLTGEAYSAVIRAASRRGLQTSGHIPEPIGVDGALDAGQSSIEHLSRYAEAVGPAAPPIPLSMSGLTNQEITARQNAIGKALLDGAVTIDELIDGARLRQIAAATARSGTSNVPTLWVQARITTQGAALEAATAEPEWAYLPPPVIASWPSIASRPDDPSPARASWLRFTEERAFRIVRALRDAGAPLLVGSDTPNPFVVPGYSVHGELGKLVEAGLTPYEALRAATSEPAAFLGTSGDFGVVARGARADLVLVGGNPLDDIANLRTPDGVMVRGNWYDRSSLSERLSEVAAEYASPP